MAEQIYYLFWALDNTKYPYNLEEVYCTSTAENDEFFIENVKLSSTVNEVNKFLVADLLRIYIDICYNKDFPDKYKTDAVKWIARTDDLLKKNNLITDFLQAKYIEDIINKYQPKSDFIYFYRLTDGKNIKNRYLRYDAVFNQMGFNYDLEDEEDDDGTTKIALKIKVYVLTELLRKLNISTNNFLTQDINKLISYLTGNSYKKIKQFGPYDFQFSRRTHKTQIDEINGILNKLNIDIKFNISGK